MFDRIKLALDELVIVLRLAAVLMRFFVFGLTVRPNGFGERNPTRSARRFRCDRTDR